MANFSLQYHQFNKHYVETHNCLYLILVLVIIHVGLSVVLIS